MFFTFNFIVPKGNNLKRNLLKIKNKKIRHYNISMSNLEIEVYLPFKLMLFFFILEAFE